MIKDRGIIKWQSMMLTEHNVEIRSWKTKDNRIERPELDEWDLQAMQYEIEVARRRQCVTNVKYGERGKSIYIAES